MMLDFALFIMSLLVGFYYGARLLSEGTEHVSQKK